MKRKIGEILIANGLINREILNEALAYQQLHGGNVTQYLIARGYLKEEDLAKCVSIQFGYPYLPLRAYDIPEDIVKLLPVSVIKKYWMMPVDKIDDIITLVMADPFDEDALDEVGRVTGCRVQPFVGILSDILKAIEKYYGINIGYEELKKEGIKTPLSVANDKYTGPERRRSVRIKARIEVHFPLQDEYKKAETKDISMNGFLFESQNSLPAGSFISMTINLPQDISPYPVPVIVKVARIAELADHRFDIGVEIIKIDKEDLGRVIQYALSQNKG